MATKSSFQLNTSINLLRKNAIPFVRLACTVAMLTCWSFKLDTFWHTVRWHLAPVVSAVRFCRAALYLLHFSLCSRSALFFDRFFSPPSLLIYPASVSLSLSLFLRVQLPHRVSVPPGTVLSWPLCCPDWRHWKLYELKLQPVSRIELIFSSIQL